MNVYVHLIGSNPQENCTILPWIAGVFKTRQEERLKGKWEQKFNLSRLKETEKQYVEIYHLFWEMYYFTSMNELSVRNLGIVFNLLKYVLVPSQQGYAIQSYS